MLKRTTIEIDEELLARAKKALGGKTTRWTVEEALRRAAGDAARDFERRREAQRRFFENEPRYIDLDVLKSREAWR